MAIMLLKLILLAIIVNHTSYTSIAQNIDNTHGYRHINTDGNSRLRYDNDFFSATDEYYT